MQMENTPLRHALKHLEALLFANAKPMPTEMLVSILHLEDKDELNSLVDLLNQKYNQADSCLCVLKSTDCFQLCVRQEYFDLLKRMSAVEEVKLSVQAMETLAIIAFKQPVIRSEIEAIRGVKIDHVLQILTEHNLVEAVGRKNAPGRPILYGTTSKFLDKFGLHSLEELPKLSEEAFMKKIINVNDNNLNANNNEENN